MHAEKSNSQAALQQELTQAVRAQKENNRFFYIAASIKPRLHKDFNPDPNPD